MIRSLLLIAGTLALAACNMQPEPSGDDTQSGQTATIDIPPSNPDGDAAEGGMLEDTNADLGSDGTGLDRVVCKAPDGSVFLDDFGSDMDPSSGRITFTSSTTGEYNAAYGSCVMRGNTTRPEGWKPVIPGGYVPKTEPAPTSQVTAPGGTPAPAPSPAPTPTDATMR